MMTASWNFYVAKEEEFKKNFVCCSSGKVSIGQNSGIFDLHYCANMKLGTQPAILANCLKSLVFLTGMTSIYENCDLFNFVTSH